MTTLGDIKMALASDPAPRFCAADGHSSTSFVWLDSAEVWLWFDRFNNQSGHCERLLLIFDSGTVSGDDLGYNRAAGLLGTDFESNPAMWVFDADECDLDLSSLAETSTYHILTGVE